MESVLEAAGLVESGDTPDKRLSVGFNTCLGACAQGPVISVDHRLLGRATPESAAMKVNELLVQPPPEGGIGQ